MNKLENEIRALVEDFVQGLSEVIRASVHEELAESLRTSRRNRTSKKTSTKTSKRAGRPTKKRAGKRKKRTAKELAAQQVSLLGLIVKKPGQTMEQLAGAMKIDTKELALPVNKLKALKKIKTKGSTRATQYFPK